MSSQRRGALADLVGCFHGHPGAVEKQTQNPGFVSDEYLNAIEADTTIAAAELEAAGIWERRPGSYFIVADDMVRMAINYNEELDRLQAECTQRGRHLPQRIRKMSQVG